MKDAQSAESNENSIFRSFRFIFFELWSILYSKFKILSIRLIYFLVVGFAPVGAAPLYPACLRVEDPSLTGQRLNQVRKNLFQIFSTFFFFKSDHPFRKDTHCRENYFLVREFFFVRPYLFEIWSILMYVTSCTQKTEQFFVNLIQTLTSEARVLNPKACRAQGRSPSGDWVEEGRGHRSPSPKNKLFFSQMAKRCEMC